MTLRSGGKWLKRAFWVSWTMLLTLAVVMPIVAVWLGSGPLVQRNKPVWELGIRVNSDGRMLRPHGPEAIAQGAVEGAKVLAVRGQRIPLEISREEFTALFRTDPGDTISIDMQLPSGERRKLSLRPDPANRDRVLEGTGFTHQSYANLVNLLLLAAALVGVATALMLALRRPRDPLALLFSTSFLLQITGLPYESWMLLDQAKLGSCLGVAGLMMMGVGLVLFPDLRRRRSWYVWLLVAAIVVLGCARTAGVLMAGLLDERLFNFLYAAVLVPILLVPVRQMRDLTDAERQQVRWVLLGMIAATLAFLVQAGIALLPTDGLAYPYRLYLSLLGTLINYLGLAFIAGGLLVSILRYRLYDAEAAISRSAAIAVLTLALAAVFAGGSKAIEVLIEARFGSAGAFPAVAGAALAVLLFLPLSNRIQAWAERRFRGRLNAFRHQLPERVGDLREVASADALLAEALNEIVAAVRSRYGAALIGNEIRFTTGIREEATREWLTQAFERRDHVMSCASDDPMFPVRLWLDDYVGRELGSILLGPRPDNSFYGSDEREVLAEIVPSLARALEVTLRRESERQATEQRLTRLEQVIADLKTAPAMVSE